MSHENPSFGPVLVVDDDRIFLTVMESLLRSRGARVILSATNGTQALEVVDRLGDDLSLILCDLEMPEVDGIQLLRHLKRRNFTGPIIIVSGTDSSIISLASKLAEKHNLNIIGALPKPLNCSDLDRVLFNRSGPVLQEDNTLPLRITDDELRSALTGEQISVHYQPKIDLATRKVSGSEAVARWNHPKLGAIGPELFAPLAERSGLAEELTDAVFCIVIEDAERWKKLRIKHSISVNLSVSAFDNFQLPDQFAAMVDGSDLDRSLFIWEIGECGPLWQSTVSMELLARLRMMGFELSMDSFETQSPGIEHLVEFPFGEMKIDYSVLGPAVHDGRTRASIEAGVALGKKLGMRIVAKGVEKESDWDLALSHGVDQVQGFFIAEPMPLERLLKWVFDYRGPDREISGAAVSSAARRQGIGVR